jgi:hypothetical protein
MFFNERLIAMLGKETTAEELEGFMEEIRPLELGGLEQNIKAVKAAHAATTSAESAPSAPSAPSASSSKKRGPNSTSCSFDTHPTDYNSKSPRSRKRLRLK